MFFVLYDDEPYHRNTTTGCFYLLNLRAELNRVEEIEKVLRQTEQKNIISASSPTDTVHYVGYNVVEGFNGPGNGHDVTLRHALFRVVSTDA